ncbi:hypothetical protein UCREL1_9294 [Eutypa lata UCREL1]|uniref:Uncharacterized protein n=1 Tax=Eutypa lata (strain UCR-EL1) TaxID=1287681 RepID=M7TAS8_EUTLA|nr:hypothetical protein UCREL1_9294 [Eutypa lata UCREL1]
MNSAWECRDQADQAEIYYNQPLRTQNRHLQDEVLSLKRLLRENGISWRPDASQEANGPLPIVDPLSKVRRDRLLVREKTKSNQIAIHFLATCRAYYVEGTGFLWNNNNFIFTTPEALRNFAEVPLIHRLTVRSVNFRIIAKFYDDEDRTHNLPSSYHPDFKKPKRLMVHKRPKDHALARRGFRAYAYYQLIDFLEAMLPPHDPTDGATDFELLKTNKRPRLLPNLERIRIDFVNFGEDMLMFPPSHLHDLASHQMGCSLNEVMLTGLPSDEAGFRVSSELGGLLKDEGLLIDHAPTMIALKNGIRVLPCDDDGCHYSSKVVRAMQTTFRFRSPGNDNHLHHQEEFPPAPKDEGEPPSHMYKSCRTLWKKVPIKLDDTEKRKWELFDRISGLPWDDVEEEVLFLEMMEENHGLSKCSNCGERHPGAILDDEFSDMDEDDILGY